MPERRILLRKSQLSRSLERKFKKQFPQGVPSSSLRRIPLGKNKRSLGVEMKEKDCNYLILLDDLSDQYRHNHLQEWDTEGRTENQVLQSILEESEELNQYAEMEAWQRSQKHDFLEDNS